MKKTRLLLLMSVSCLLVTNCEKVDNSEPISEDESTSIYRPSWVVDSKEESTIDEDDIDILSPDYVNTLGETFYGVQPINRANGSIYNWQSQYSDGKCFKNSSNIVYEQAYVNNTQVNEQVTWI